MEKNHVRSLLVNNTYRDCISTEDHTSDILTCGITVPNCSLRPGSVLMTAGWIGLVLFLFFSMQAAGL